MLYGFLVVQDNLSNAELIPQVKECYAAVIADGIHPPGQLNRLPDMLLTQRSAGMCSVLVHAVIMPIIGKLWKWGNIVRQALSDIKI